MHFPLEIELHSSLWLRASLAGFHGLAAVAFVTAAWRTLPLPVTAIVTLCVAASAFLSDRAERRKSGLQLVLGDSGLLTVEPGVVESAALQSGSADHGWAVWLRWRSSGAGAGSRSGAVMLVPGNLAAGDWRRLRIWLRHKASAGAAV